MADEKCHRTTVKRDFRIEVEMRHGHRFHRRSEEEECTELAHDLNDLFKSHGDWVYAKATARWEAVPVCSLCGHAWEPGLGSAISPDDADYDADTLYCAYCGAEVQAEGATDG